MEQENGAHVVAIPVPPTEKKKVNIFMITTIAAGVLAVIFLILMIVQISENGKLKDENSKLKTEVATLNESALGADKKVLKSSTTNKTVELKQEGVATAETGTVSVVDSVKYLEPKEWDVKFKYPAGVTDIAYATNADNFDGALYITGIAKGAKVYDVNICGGKEKYEQYPFYLGELNRWNPTGEHEEWETSPSSYEGMKRLLKSGSFEYYANTYYGNGCELGDDTPDYVEATKLAKEILESVQTK